MRDRAKKLEDAVRSGALRAGSDVAPPSLPNKCERCRKPCEGKFCSSDCARSVPTKRCPYCKEIVRHDEASDFCGPVCLEKAEKDQTQRKLRAELEQRDHGVCQNCNLDTLWLRSRLDDLKARAEAGDLDAERFWKVQVDNWAKKGFDFPRSALETPGETLWNAAHLKAHVKGGITNPSNAVTWCRGCHARDTKKLSKDRAEERSERPRPRRRIGRR